MLAHLMGMLDINSILETLEYIDHSDVSEKVCKKGDEVDLVKMDKSLEK